MASKTMLAFALAALLAVPVTHADVEAFSRYEADAWRVTAYKQVESGRFSHCAIATGDSGPRFSLDAAYGLGIALGVPEASAEESSSAQLVVDGRLVGSFPASREGALLLLRFGRRPDVYRILRQGAAVQIRTEGGRLEASLAGADRALPRLRECVDLVHSFSTGTDNPYLPGNEPAYPGPRRPRAEDDPRDTRGRIRSLLTAAGLQEVRFVDPEDVGAAGAALAWTSGNVLGLALLETRKERSTEELRVHHVERFASRCVRRPALRGFPDLSVGGYTLYQSEIGCEGENDSRVIVATSILDDNDILTLFHLGQAREAQRLQATNRALRDVLGVVLRQ